MRAMSDSSGFSANDPSGKPDVECCGAEQPLDGKTFGVRIDVDAEWFTRAARQLYARKGGTELHFLTDYDERLCQKYVAGSVKPSAYFLRTLQRGPHGEQWLNAIMAGSNAQWWLDLQRDAEIGRKVREITK